MTPPWDREADATAPAAAVRENSRKAGVAVINGTGTGQAETTRRRRFPPVYGALDLGTNNCRLLLARPQGPGFRVVDAFSRIIRLGEGVTQTGALSEAAMDRTIEALQVCTQKMARRNVRRTRLIATEACRAASNGDAFVERVRRETGLNLEIVSRETEAHLAVAGCAALLDPLVSNALVFDIGGGSSELMWVSVGSGNGGSGVQRRDQTGSAIPDHSIRAWTSLPVGVVSLSEAFGGVEVTRDVFAKMVDHVREHMAPFEAECSDRMPNGSDGLHLLGTSGTVTTVAGVHLGLRRYERSRVDGCWLDRDDCHIVVDRLLCMNFEERVRSPCIGRERADLVLAGCAILAAIQQAWPARRLRVADRGLREGILSELMTRDGYLRPRRRSRGRGRGGNRAVRPGGSGA